MMPLCLLQSQLLQTASSPSLQASRFAREQKHQRNETRKRQKNTCADGLVGEEDIFGRATRRPRTALVPEKTRLGSLGRAAVFRLRRRVWPDWDVDERGGAFELVQMESSCRGSAVFGVSATLDNIWCSTGACD